MHRQVLSILRRHANKLLAARCAQRAVRAGTAGALAAAVVVLAGTCSYMYPWATRLVCVAAIIILAGVLAARQFSIMPWRLGGGEFRRPPAGPRATLARTAGVDLVAVVLAMAAWTAAAVRPGELALLPRWCPLLLAPLIAAVAAVVAMFRGVAVHEAAAWLDARADLRQRLVTAAELAERSAATPAALAVYAQAIEAMAKIPGRDRKLQESNPPWAAALGLSLALAALLTLVPVWGLAPQDADVLQLAQSVPTLSAAQRAQLTEAFRKAAAAAAADPNIAAQLARAAAVVEVQDAQELQKVLARLRALGYQPLDCVPASLLAAAGLAPRGGQNAATLPSPKTGDANSGPLATRAGPDGTVRVFDPAYVALVRAAATQNAAPSVPMPSFEDAWSAARARAASAARSGQFPPQYQQLIRDYFRVQKED